MEHPFRKLSAVIVLLLPMIISRYVAVGKYAELYLPTFQEAVTISFSQIHMFADNVTQAVSALEKTGDSLSPDNFKEILVDLPRHDSFRYINDGSLTEDYFRKLEFVEELRLNGGRQE